MIVPINDINLATLGSLCISNSDNDIRIRDILAHGLSNGIVIDQIQIQIQNHYH